MSTPSPSEKAGEASGATKDWRATVQQSYRSSEVREIAKVLASLEPDATPTSKLMLAMRFEDSIFAAADSLADYRKKITKRLKKLQKSYVPTAVAAKAETNSTDVLEEKIALLRNKYADALRFIANNADSAVAVMEEKSGTERATQLKQHTDNVKKWATDLGVVSSSSDQKIGLSRTEKQAPVYHMDLQKLERLEQHLQQRIDNIRSHVVKLVEPDTFLYETLEKLETELTDDSSQLLAAATSRRLHRLGWNEFQDPAATLQQSLDKALVPVPLSTRNQNNEREAALLHLEKMRAASQALLAFMAIPHSTTSAAVPRNVLPKCHTVIVQGIKFLSQVMPALSSEEKKAPKVTLEDAWSKVLELPATDGVSSSLEQDNNLASLPSESSPLKKQKLHDSPVVIKSRVLLTPGRKTPSNLLPALRRKSARLVRPPPDGLRSHLVLEFGDAFIMTIYLVPLIVTIRATQQQASLTSETVTHDASWTPVGSGLANQPELLVLGVSASPTSLAHVVEQRLDQASAHATYILRKCFTSATLRVKNDYEMEISEATALLQFLQIARTTYTPDFEDAED